MAGGYEVTLVGSGGDAVSALEITRPDLIVVDLSKAPLTEAEVLEILDRAVACGIPLVALADIDHPVVCAWSVERIRHIIYRPCRPRTLLAGVADAIRFRY